MKKKVKRNVVNDLRDSLVFVLCENTVELSYSSFKVRNHDICSRMAFGNGADTVWCGMEVVWDNVPSRGELFP